MATGTVTKTYTENSPNNSYKSTWTVTVSWADITTTASTFTISPPTVTAKYTSSVTKGIVGYGFWIDCLIGGSKVCSFYYANSGAGVKKSKGTVFSVVCQSVQDAIADVTVSGKNIICGTSRFISSSSKTATISFRMSLVDLSSGNGTLDSTGWTIGSYYNSYYSTTLTTLLTGRSVTLNAPPTFTESVLSKDTDDYYAGITTVSVTISNASAQYGGNISSSKLTVGNQSVSGNGNGTLSMTLANAGTFMPTVSVTDSRGQTTTVSLSEITVLPYSVPSVNFDVYRTDASGVKADEGRYGLIEGTIDYTSSVTNLVAPSVKINGTTTSNVSWYSDRALTTAINWSNVASGATVYGLINGSFAETNSYEITLTAEDALGSESTPITQTLSTAFYTIDFKAGGKEIAFGRPANDNLTNIHGKDVSDYGFFKCGMEAEFEKDVVVDGDVSTDNITATGDVSADNITATGDVSDSGGNVLSDKIDITGVTDGISIRTQDVDVTIAASSYTTSQVTETCTPVSGFTARCAVGWYNTNQTNGANASLVNVYQLYVSQSDQTIHIAARNTATTQAKIIVHVLVLYTRNA